jgi:hypothetical protein
MAVVGLELLLEQRNHLRRPFQIRVDVDGAPEQLEGTPGIAEPKVDLSGAGQRAEVLRDCA